MTTPTASQLRAELDLLTKSMAEANPNRLTIEEWRAFKAKVAVLKARIANLKSKND